MGSDGIALPALNWLVSAAKDWVEVVAVFTQPDRAVGRGQKISANAIKTWALAQGLPVHQPVKLGSVEREQLAALQPDITLVMAYGHILRPEFINTPPRGTLNLHTSILPAYRGASPIQTALASGETATGITLMRIVPELDAGPIAGQERVIIDPLDTALAVEAKLAQASVVLLQRLLPAILAGTQIFTEQNSAAATFCRRLEKSDSALDFNAPARVLAARINGLAAWPSCTVLLNGQSIKLGLADVSNLTQYQPVGAGVVYGSDADGLLVDTGQGLLRLRQLQRPGGKMLSAAEFLRGFPVPTATALPGQAMAPLVAARAFTRSKG